MEKIQIGIWKLAFLSKHQTSVFNSVCGRVSLHFLIAKLMSTSEARFLVEVFLFIYNLFWSVLMLVSGGVFGPHTAPYCSA